VPVEVVGPVADTLQTIHIKIRSHSDWHGRNQAARIRAVEFPDKVKKIRQTSAERSAIGRARSASANCSFLRPARSLQTSQEAEVRKLGTFDTAHPDDRGLNSGSSSTICALPGVGRNATALVAAPFVIQAGARLASQPPMRAKYHASEDIARNKSRNPRYRKSVTSFCRESDITAVECRRPVW
jgi:hypothetical protein